MNKETVTTSQSGESQETENTALSEAFSAFGLTPPQKEQEETPATETEPAPEETLETEESEEELEVKKGITVKYNKQERFIDESEIPELVQKGLVLEKERERKSEYEKKLDRLAKIAGYQDHADLLANIDTLERQAAQRQQDYQTQLRNDLRQQAEEAGLDPARVEAWIDNHPLVKEAERIKQEAESQMMQYARQMEQEQMTQKWSDLLTKYPDLATGLEQVEQGVLPDWLTPNMESLLNRGYDPVHAYELTHQEEIRDRDRKKTEQKVIKEQMLGKRAQVETKPQADPEPEVPETLKSAFALFGLDPKAAKKYVKK